ncbi:2Fe-2S iron-sulfur cluster-binding protein [Fulvivirga lutea]|uniref:(2Fe-2S)-binding protein n=1 Tax=Fulvivirga lutea TaxID=2810512 RepID=A0A974WG17_9BACT|nr:2Fe-2S iron-sulfur cluster-binding protein [Fulvivirga lutea]QSE97798.1 (2Fe-2S)-binding protein [Fulvivirga lutea]
MVKITISNLNNLTIKSNDTTKPVLSILQDNFVDWMHACGGKGRCTTCKFKVVKGGENLSSITDAEQKFANMNRLNLKSERLCCQVRLEKDEVEIEVPDESKLPHLDYTY